MDTQQNRHLGQQLGLQLGRQIKETNAFSGRSLFLGILASLVCTAIIPALGAGRIATLAGATLSPLLVAVITTQGAGLIRSAGVAALSAVALVISIGGFTLPEAIAGHGSLTADGDGTFVNTRRGPTPTPPAPLPTKSTVKPGTQPTKKPGTTQPTNKPQTPPSSQAGLQVPEGRKCPEVVVGEAESCKQIGLRNVGTTTLQVTTSDLEGEQAGDFVLTKVCNGTLKPHTACSVRLRFRPTAAGVREASVVVHVTPGGVARRVTISGNAIDNSEDKGADPPPTTPTPSPSSEPPTPVAPSE
jgi:hypothetical protein